MRTPNEREYRRSVNAATLLYVCGWLPGVIANWRLRRRYHLWAGVNEQKLPWAGVVEFQFWAFTVTLPLLALLVCLLALVGRTGARAGPAWRSPRPQTWLASPVACTPDSPTATPAPRPGAPPPAQYVIHVPGVSVRPSFVDGPGVYSYRLTARVVRGDYEIFVAPLHPQRVRAETVCHAGRLYQVIDPRAHRDPQWVRAETVGMVKNAWEASPACCAVYRHMVRFGHPFDVTYYAYTPPGSTRFCFLNYGASHGRIGFQLDLQTHATCAAATRAATPVVDALLTKIY